MFVLQVWVWRELESSHATIYLRCKAETNQQPPESTVWRLAYYGQFPSRLLKKVLFFRELGYTGNSAAMSPIKWSELALQGYASLHDCPTPPLPRSVLVERTRSLWKREIVLLIRLWSVLWEFVTIVPYACIVLFNLLLIGPQNVCDKSSICMHRTFCFLYGHQTGKNNMDNP